MSNIQLTIGNITGARVDAIVNAANSALQRGGGVCGAIHAAAGPQLQEACNEIERVDGIRCPVGEARITEAGNLPAGYVIHAVGPRYQVDAPSDELLASACPGTRLSTRGGTRHLLRDFLLPAGTGGEDRPRCQQ